MGDICTITAAQQAASDQAAKNALDNSKAAGTSSKLDAMQAHTQAAIDAWVAGGPLVVVPKNIIKKHDVINYFLSQGLKGQEVVDAMATKGFKIKIADVYLFNKTAATEKIPANFPKAGTVAPIKPIPPLPGT